VKEFLRPPPRPRPRNREFDIEDEDENEDEDDCGPAGKIEERGINAASRSKLIEGAAKLESVWFFHVEAA